MSVGTPAQLRTQSTPSKAGPSRSRWRSWSRSRTADPRRRCPERGRRRVHDSEVPLGTAHERQVRVRDASGRGLRHSALRPASQLQRTRRVSTSPPDLVSGDLSSWPSSTAELGNPTVKSGLPSGKFERGGRRRHLLTGSSRNIPARVLVESVSAQFAVRKHAGCGPRQAQRDPTMAALTDHAAGQLFRHLLGLADLSKGVSSSTSIAQPRRPHQGTRALRHAPKACSSAIPPVQRRHQRGTGRLHHYRLPILPGYVDDDSHAAIDPRRTGPRWTRGNRWRQARSLAGQIQTPLLRR